MIRRIALSLALALSLPALAVAQGISGVVSVDGPESISEDQLAEYRVVGIPEGAKVRATWVVIPDASEYPDSNGQVFVFTGKPGAYTLLIFLVDHQADTQFDLRKSVTITPSGARPPPTPTPTPDPAPDPPSPPSPPPNPTPPAGPDVYGAARAAYDFAMALPAADRAKAADYAVALDRLAQAKATYVRPGHDDLERYHADAFAAVRAISGNGATGWGLLDDRLSDWLRSLYEESILPDDAGYYSVEPYATLFTDAARGLRAALGVASK